MSISPIPGAPGSQRGGHVRKQWVKPKVTRIVAGSAEAISRDGQPDGADPPLSRS